MIIFLVLLLALSVFEIHSLGQYKKDVIVILGLTITALILGVIYISDPYRHSITYNILKILGK